MYIESNKKNGYVLIEVLLIVTILILLIVSLSNLAVNNMLKSELYTSKNDLKTLNITEEKLINKAELEINDDEKLKNIFLNNDEFKLLVKSYSSLEDNNLRLEIKNGRIYLVNYLMKQRRYREMIIKNIIKSGKSELMIIPTNYKSDYLP